MTKYSYNHQYLIKDGKPWFPVMGEMHYSRYPKAYWKESIYKMKAGGVEVVSTYVIWIHHEEIEGEYDFSGNRDLRGFLQVCKECEVAVILRIGPWVHGEVRNGGFPDWLLKKEYPTRKNDIRYFAEVEKFYSCIYKQVKGYLLKEKGPVIGIQIENEYGHVGGLQGEEGEQHMRKLLELAKKVGFEVPIYTATGWGGAVTGGMLPVMGGYCDAPWDASFEKLPPNGNYIFTKERNDHNIGSDYKLGYGITFDIEQFPYLTAELGGGLQVTQHRRPVADAKDIGAMTVVKLGSGANLLGYYMYHGGTNPKGKLTTLQESKETGSPNDLPIMNYDFHAPIREYGQISETYKEIKLIASFLQDFGSELCEMSAVFPNENPLLPTNRTDVRIAFRKNESQGYVFINNYQRHYSMAEHKDYVIQVPLLEETILFPPITIYDKEFFFYPVNMKIGKAKLKFALATPLCRLENLEETVYVFYTEKEPVYQIEGEIKKEKILTLSREEAKNSYKVIRKKEYLFLSESAVIDKQDRLCLIGRTEPSFRVYPALEDTPEGFVRLKDQEGFTEYHKEVIQGRGKVSFTELKRTKQSSLYEIQIQREQAALESQEAYLILSYRGDSAQLWIDGVLEDDHFYQGEHWEIGLRRYGFPKKVLVEITVLKETDLRFLEVWPKMEEGGQVCCLDTVEMEEEFQTEIFLS